MLHGMAKKKSLHSWVVSSRYLRMLRTIDKVKLKLFFIEIEPVIFSQLNLS